MVLANKVIIGDRIEALFVGCRYVKTKLWFPIQKLTLEVKDGEYRNLVTVNLKGAAKLREIRSNPHVVGFGSLDKIRMDWDLGHSPIGNRLPLARAVNPKLKRALGFDGNKKVDPVKYAARSGGYRHGDNRDMFPQVMPDSAGKCNFYFLPVDRYTFAGSKPQYLARIEVEQPCYLEHGRLLTGNNTDIGTVPDYIKDLFGQFGDKLKLSIARVNPGFPMPYFLLIKARLNQTDGVPFTTENYAQF